MPAGKGENLNSNVGFLLRTTPVMKWASQCPRVFGKIIRVSDAQEDSIGGIISRCHF